MGKHAVPEWIPPRSESVRSSELAELRRKARCWDAIAEIARTANDYGHLEPDEIARVVAEAEAAGRDGGAEG